MSHYVIGDVQGCYDELMLLCKKIKFNPKKDKLIFAGDLVNRGPKSLEVLNFCLVNKKSIKAVLGNHDFYLLYLIEHKKRNKSLTVAGPPGTIELMNTTLQLFFPGIPDAPFPLEYRNLDPEMPYNVGPVTTIGFEVDHYSNGTAFGYRLSWSGRNVVYSGDTAWTDALVCQTAGADLCVCECSSFEKPLPRHMSYRELERNADRLKARRTLLVHAGEDVLSRRKDLVFELADDGKRITI